jgi:predicted transcriptional regulator
MKKSPHVHIVMPEYLKAQVQQLADERNISAAKIIVEAVSEYLKREAKQKTDAS